MTAGSGRPGGGGSDPRPDATVAVVGICGAEHLERCLAALDEQVAPPDFDVVVVHDPRLPGMAEVAARHGARAVANRGQRTPLELASRAVEEARGEAVALTEDHCVPRPDWLARLCRALRSAPSAVGGAVETDPDAGSVDWAFYFVDFFRYARPARPGPSPSLTVCNVAYRREQLAAVREVWEELFHETAVNDALRERFGPLRLVPEAEVRMRRRVSLGDALRERYAFGRLFGCTRLRFTGPARRALYALAAPALPALLLGRMAAKAVGDPDLRSRFVRSLPTLSALVLAWSWGEWLGYLTGRRAASELVAPEAAGARGGSPETTRREAPADP